MTLHNLLFLQEFDSPAIFLLKFPEISKRSPMEANLRMLVSSYAKIAERYKCEKNSFNGDSIGATLILNHLCAQCNIFLNENISKTKNGSPDVELEPFSAILISPIVSFKIETNKSDNDIYLKASHLGEISSFYCGNYKSSGKLNPAIWRSVKIWNIIVPKGGWLLYTETKKFKRKV